MTWNASRYVFGEQRVVVEHFFKVGNQPAFIRRIPGKPSPDVVVHASGGHGIQRFTGHLKDVLRPGALVLPEEKGESGGRWKFGSLPEPAIDRIEVR